MKAVRLIKWWIQLPSEKRKFYREMIKDLSFHRKCNKILYRKLVKKWKKHVRGAEVQTLTRTHGVYGVVLVVRIFRGKLQTLDKEKLK